MTPGASGRGRGRPQRSEREAGSSRQELLDAALTVFADKGYAGATVEEIIRRAGLSKGTFYFNFAGKEDLFLEIVRTRLDDPARALMAITATAPGDTPTAGAVGAAVAELLIHERSTLLLLQEYWAQATRDDALAARYRERQHGLRTVLAQTIEERHRHTGVPLLFDAPRLAEAFLALAQGLALEAVVDPRAVDAALFGDLLALVYDGLVARAQKSP